MEYNLQVQNHLFICAVVKELLEGIPLRNILDIGIKISHHLRIFKEYINHTAYKNSILNASLSKSVITTLQ